MNVVSFDERNNWWFSQDLELRRRTSGHRHIEDCLVSTDYIHAVETCRLNAPIGLFLRH